MTPAENKSLRESMGLTLQWLADRWGVTLQNVKRWENGRTLPPMLAKDMLALKRSFDDEVANLVDSEEESVTVPRHDSKTKRGGKPAAWSRAVAQRANEQTGIRIRFADEDEDTVSIR